MPLLNSICFDSRFAVRALWIRSAIGYLSWSNDGGQWQLCMPMKHPKDKKACFVKKPKIGKALAVQCTAMLEGHMDSSDLKMKHFFHLSH
jgi:hypothetical protein